MRSNFPEGVTGYEYQIDPPEPPEPFSATCGNDMRDVVPYGELKLKAEGSAGMTAKELVAWADELREAACTTQCSYTATIDTFEFSAGHWIWICPACSEHHMIGEEPND